MDSDNSQVLAPRRFAPSLATLFYRNRYALTLFIMVTLLSGWSALTNLPRIEDPRIVNRYSLVSTLLPGASAERVEALVTDPLETELRELSEIKRIESVSKTGFSSLQLELQESIGSTEVDQIYSKIRSKLRAAATSLPPEASAPVLDDKVSAIAFSLIVSVNWDADNTPPLNMMKRLSEQLAEQLRDLPGTDVVRLFGAPQEEIAVTIDSENLAAVGLSADQVARIIAANDPKTSAGALRNSRRNLLLEVAGELNSAAMVANITLATDATGSRLSLGDVADVRRAWRDPPTSLARSNQRRSILIAAHTEQDIRIDKWATQAHAVVDDFRQNNAQGVEVDYVFDQSGYTNARLKSLSGNLLAGAGVVMLVVFLGMGWRAALVVGMALPLSASLTLFWLTFTDQQIHQMSIFGMIVAIGLLIDNAIVMTDEIKQRRDMGMARLDAVKHAVSHLFVPLLASTLTTILGFMPVFLLPGAAGDFVGPIALAVVLALMASLLISLSVIPAIGGMILPATQREHSVSWLRRALSKGLSFSGMSSRYKTVLGQALKIPWLTLLLCMTLPISGFVLSRTLNQEFFPAADRDQFEIEIYMPSGAALDETTRFVKTLEKDIFARPGVKETHALVGNTFPTVYYNRIMRVSNDSTHAHIIVYTDSVTDAQRLVSELQSHYAERFPQAQVLVKPFWQGPPVQSPVGYRIVGPDIETLRILGQELRRIMHTVPDIAATRATIAGGQAKLSVQANEQSVRLAGMQLNQVAAQLHTALEGGVGGSVLENLESLPVRIRVDQDARNNVAAVESVRLQSPASRDWIPLHSLGEVSFEPDIDAISRFDGMRINRILGYLRHGAYAIDVSQAITKAVNDVNFTLPAGYRLVPEGDAAEQGEALGDLTIYLPVLLMLMVTTLVLSFRSVSLAAVIGIVGILSVGMGLFALWLGRFPLGFTAIIGSVGLIGVAINGTIVVLASIRSDDKARAGDRDAIVHQTGLTTRHILSTTLTTIGGFAPLLLFTEGDFWPPLAVVIAGGVGFSIILSLFFAPAAYRALAVLIRPSP